MKWFGRFAALCLLGGFAVAEEITPDNVVRGEVIFKLSANTALLRGSSLSTGTAAVDRILLRYGVESVTPMFPSGKTRRSDLPDISRIYRATYDKSIAPFAVAKALAALPEVVYAEPNYTRRQYDVPNDTRFNNQWHLSKISAAAAWDISHGDSTVIIGIVDSGTDMDHPDLEANIWVNEAELNGLSGRDDDDNGYVDDIRGWDFADDDNNPDNAVPENMHGTHVAGLANAVTNNEVGVAGVAWNVKMLITKHGYDDDTPVIVNGFQGIVYAAELGAHVINCSWGGGGYSQYEADVIDYVTGLGALVVVASGNENSDALSYPSFYENVFSVAATSRSDQRADFSNFGMWVDGATPGVSVLSTLPDESYGQASGTSMSSPVAAGVAALVKSFYPDLSPHQLARRMAGTADNIDSNNPDYAGLLGTGRFNAENALAYDESQFVIFKPKLMLTKTTVSEGGDGDGNGVYDKGESADVTVTYRSFSLGATENFTVRLSSGDPDLSVTSAITADWTVPADTTFSISGELSFAVAEDAEGHMAELVLEGAVDGTVVTQDTLSILIGKTPVLLVADDWEDCCGDVRVDGFYEGILKENAVSYGVWDHSKHGSPSAETLKSFPIVIWFTEWDFPSLDSLDRAALRAYMDGGGNLYLSGQDLGWDLNENPGTDDQTTFFKDYLRADWGGDDSGSRKAEGVLGDPISHGLSFTLHQPGLQRDSQYPDWFTPKNGAVPIFHYNNGKVMGLRYKDDYRLVYTGMGLEAFGSVITSKAPEDINDIQRTVLARILTYLNFIQHTRLTDTETTDEDFGISVNVAGDTADVAAVRLYYKMDSMTDYQAVEMVSGDGTRFKGTIPAPGEASRISYYMESVHDYYSWTNPSGAPESMFTFYAGPDSVLPESSFITELDDRIDRTGSAEIWAFAQDNIGVKEVTIEKWTSNDPSGTVVTVPMELRGRIWKAKINWADLPGNTTISYRIKVTDSSSNENVDRSEVFTFRIINYTQLTDWEHEDLSKWDTGDGWGAFFFNPSVGWLMNDSPQENYEDNSVNTLRMLNYIDLSSYESAYLSFWTLSMLEEEKDWGCIDLSAGHGWTTVSCITGLGVIREEEIVDLSPYLSEGRVKARFQVITDEQNSLQGWYLGEMSLLVDTTLQVTTVPAPEPLPMSFGLEQNYPNPFNPATTIAFSLPEAADARLAVYDVLGRVVKVLVSSALMGGRHEVMWDGTDAAFNSAPSGIYLAHLTAGGFSATRKLVLLR